ncbi:MAG: hypothetical protein ABIP94_20665 [Planctomycetota bacterium]
MNPTIRRFTRFLLLILLTASLGACHFHGCGGGGGWGHGAPSRHCR